MKNNEWIFPQSTCERTLSTNTIIQPYSFCMNAINVLLLLYSAFLVQTNHIKITILSFALFEIVHTLSHAMHVNRHLHEISVHLCGYIMMIMIYYTLSIETGYVFSTHNKVIVACAILLDIFVFFTIRSIYSIATGLLVIAVMLMQFLSSLHTKKKNTLTALILGTFVLFILFIIEKQYCSIFQKYHFQYHAFVIEVWGIILFQLLVQFVT